MECRDPLLSYLTRELDFMAIRCPRNLLPLTILRDRPYNSGVQVVETEIGSGMEFERSQFPEFGQVSSSEQGLRGMLKWLPWRIASAKTLDRRTAYFWFQDVSRVSIGIRSAEDVLNNLSPDSCERLEDRCFHSVDSSYYRYWLITDVLQSCHFRIGANVTRDTTAQGTIPIDIATVELSAEALSEYDQGKCLQYYAPGNPLSFAYRASRLVYEGGSFRIDDTRLDRHAGDEAESDTSTREIDNLLRGYIRDVDWLTD